MSKVMRFYNPKTNQYEPINAGGVLDENTGEILTGTDIDKKADKSYVDEKIGDIDFAALEDKIDNKANKSHTHSANDITETYSKKFVTTPEKLKINEIDNKADKSYVDDKISSIDTNQFDAINKGGYSFNNLKEPGVYRLWNSSTSPCGTTDDYITAVFKYNDKITQVAHSSTTTSSRENRVYTRYYTGSRWTSWRELTADNTARSSTIVIANYDSKDSSKKGADIVINKGENASKKINDAIQSLKGTGGEVKLMEGNYNLEYGIAVNVDGVHLTGIPKATILVQNTNWKGNPYANDRKHIIDTWRSSNRDNVGVEISNLHVKGVKVSGSDGFSCYGSSTVNNCISENSGSTGFSCYGSPTVNNCISENSGWHGFSCYDSSTVNNCISENSGSYGFNCGGSSTVNNCISENSGRHGFNCGGSSTVNNCISENSSSDGFYCGGSSTVNNCISENSGSDGFSCYGSPTVSNCISENSGRHGFYCAFSLEGVCGFNTLIGDTLNDNSSSPAVVQYNILKEV